MAGNPLRNTNRNGPGGGAFPWAQIDEPEVWTSPKIHAQNKGSEQLLGFKVWGFVTTSWPFLILFSDPKGMSVGEMIGPLPKPYSICLLSGDHHTTILNQ